MNSIPYYIAFLVKERRGFLIWFRCNNNSESIASKKNVYIRERYGFSTTIPSQGSKSDRHPLEI
jgi:hypothetical protein